METLGHFDLVLALFAIPGFVKAHEALDADHALQPDNLVVVLDKLSHHDSLFVEMIEEFIDHVLGSFPGWHSDQRPTKNLHHIHALDLASPPEIRINLSETAPDASSNEQHSGQVVKGDKILDALLPLVDLI